MHESQKDLIYIGNAIKENHKDDIYYFSLSALSSRRAFVITDNADRFDLDDNDLPQYGLEPILREVKQEYLGEKDILAILKNAKSSGKSQKFSDNILIHATAHQISEQKYIAYIKSKISNRLLCSKLGSKPFHGHIIEDSVIHCGKTIAAIPFVESGYFLAKTVSQEIKNYKKQYFMSPKVLLMENRGYLVFANNPDSLIKTIKSLEIWSDILSNVFSFSSPKYLSHEQIIAIEKNFRDKNSFLANLKNGD